MHFTGLALGAFCLSAAASLALAGTSANCAPENLPEDLKELAQVIGPSSFPQRCTKTIETGALGPFEIGQSKSAVLRALEATGITSINFRPFGDVSLPASDRRMANTFASEPGLRVWIGREPAALRLEFVGNELVRVSGYDPALAQVEALQSHMVKLEELQADLSVGSSRSDVFATLSRRAKDLSLSVAAFIPGGEHVPLPLADRAVHLQASDNWQFAGLESICPFKPFYSNWRLTFRAERLTRVEHFCFPWELP